MRFAALLLLLTLAQPLSAQEDSRTVFRRATDQPRGSAESIALLQRYVALEPDDPWGYLALAESQAAARRFADARRALAAAEKLAPEEPDVAIVKQRVERARRATAPALSPRIAYTRDSDGNELLQSTVAGDVYAGGVRLGVSGTRANTSDEFDSSAAEEARAHANLRTRTTRIELSAGMAKADALTTPVARARIRYHPSPRGALLEARVQRAPLLVSPLLVANEVVLSEARGLIELPVAGALRVRATGQRGQMASSTTKNTRTGLGGGLVLHTGASSELSAGAFQLDYDAPSFEGYFAPDKAQLAEAGMYAEIYRFDPLTISFDVGAGAQRVMLHGEEFGAWKPALRAWAMATLPVGSAVELNLETDWYRSQLSTVATSASWSSFMVGVGVRVLVP